MAKTFYLNDSGKQIPAHVFLEDANPSDTTVRVMPDVYGGQMHIIKWPAKGSNTKPGVWQYVERGDLDLVPTDQQFVPYWQRAGKEALHNAQWNWLERTFGNAKKLQPVEQKQTGGTVESREFPPTWNQGTITQSMQRQPRTEIGRKARNWLYEVGKTLEDPNEVGPLVVFNPLVKYITGQGNESDFAAMIPGIGAVKGALTLKQMEANLPKMLQKQAQQQAIKEARSDAQKVAAKDWGRMQYDKYLNTPEIRAERELDEYFNSVRRGITGLEYKCGGKVKKHACGSTVKKAACGGKSKKLMRSGGRIIEVSFD